MANPIWIDVTTADKLKITLNAAFIVGISFAPRAAADGTVTYDQLVVNMTAPVYPGGTSIWLKGTAEELRDLIEHATHKAR